MSGPARDTSNPAPLLALGATPQDAERLRAALTEAGAAPVEAGTCLALVQQVVNAAPQQVIFYLPQGVGDLQAAVAAAWAGRPPCPLSLIAPGLRG